MSTIYTACGLVANVDRVAKLDEKLLKKVKKHSKKSISNPSLPSPFLSTWEELLNAIYWNIENGSGAEYGITSKELSEELRTFTNWHSAIGGTGLQAACAIAAAGGNALVNLDSWNAEYNFLLDYEGLECSVDRETTPYFCYIFEYNIGSKSNRIILREPRSFKDGLFSKEFFKKVTCESKKYTRILISGYSAVNTSQEVSDLIKETIILLDAIPSSTFVHLELSSMFSTAELRKVICKLSSHVDSVGMNEDELKDLVHLDCPLLDLSDRDLIYILTDTQRRLNIKNLIVHTHQFAACISRESASGWREALQNGINFATARAVNNKLCSFSEIKDIELQLQKNTRGVELTNKTKDKMNICVVPALVAEVKSTVGLGDTFTAGLIVKSPHETTTSMN